MKQTTPFVKLINTECFRLHLKNVDLELYNLISNYAQVSKSSGCNQLDYVSLYKSIREFKFKEVFEAGTGVSTVVISYALWKNHQEGGKRGRVTSMEELHSYYKMALKCLPKFLRPYTNITFSSTIHDYFGMFHGIRYKDIPDRDYDFCWIDGPNFGVPSSKGRISFDFDFISIVNNNKGKMVYGLIDGRMPTVYALQSLFGVTKVKSYNKGGVLSLVDGVNTKDLDKFRTGKYYGKNVKIDRVDFKMKGYRNGV